MLPYSPLPTQDPWRQALKGDSGYHIASVVLIFLASSFPLPLNWELDHIYQNESECLMCSLGHLEEGCLCSIVWHLWIFRLGEMTTWQHAVSLGNSSRHFTWVSSNITFNSVDLLPFLILPSKSNKEGRNSVHSCSPRSPCRQFSPSAAIAWEILWSRSISEAGLSFSFLKVFFTFVDSKEFNLTENLSPPLRRQVLRAFLPMNLTWVNITLRFFGSTNTIWYAR